jgi:hypothetical protein
MRRSLIIAACFALLALVSASAQRGGHGGGFGGHGGGHSFGGFSSASHGFGSHNFSGMRASSRAGFRFSGGFGDRSFHHHGGFRHCFGCRARFGFPWFAGFGYGPYDPFWWSDHYDSYDYDQERDREIAAQENALNLQEQNLRDREDWLRSREQDSYRQPQTSNEAPSKPPPATVLVFRDQHRQEITNYAISSGTLWVLSDHAVAKKIPLADLDLDATAKANDERGVEFQVPR